MKRLDHNGQHFFETDGGRFVKFSDVEVLLAELNLLRSEVANLKHDMERGMANHNADLNAAVPEGVQEIGHLMVNEYGFVSAHVPDLRALSKGKTVIYKLSVPQEKSK